MSNNIYRILTLPILMLSICCNSPSIETPGVLVKSHLPRNLHPTATQAQAAEVVSGNIDFGTLLLQQMDGANENKMVAPLCLGTVLAMAYAGAREGTKTDLEKVLHVPTELAGDKYHDAFNFLESSLQNLQSEAQSKDGSSGMVLKINSAAFAQKGYAFSSNFLDLLQVNYGTGISLFDFINDSKSAVSEINKWVDASTNGKIPTLFDDIASDARLFLVNAVYFEGRWSKEFKSSATESHPFNLKDGTTKAVKMMQQQDRFLYAENSAGYQAIEMPYKGGRLVMDVFLPAQGTFEEFVGSLNAARLQEMVNELSTQDVKLKFPKFKFEAGGSVRAPLAQIGLHNAMSPSGADFSGMRADAQRDLYISDVIHKTYIEVDEEGTKAAAVSSAGVATRSSRPPELKVYEFFADRPFIFAIRDLSTGAVLFLGTVLFPKAT